MPRRPCHLLLGRRGTPKDPALSTLKKDAMKITKSNAPRGIIGITGHCGAGHAHSNFGFVQDDSAGFAVAIALLRNAFPVDTTIASVDADIHSGVITVKTQGGGKGSAQARRGITPFESSLASRAVGMDAIYSQGVAMAAFGRIYGQGVLELPVALQTAACLAVMDAFEKRYPGAFVTGVEDMPEKVGKVMGAVVEMDGVPVSVMAILNASAGGLGPDEDLEGNIALGDKGRAMKELGLDRLPTIILESKAFVPAICKELQENHVWIRANGETDNRKVFEALVQSTQSRGLPCMHSDSAYPRATGDMARGTLELGETIAELGKAFAKAETSREKVRIAGELAIIVSQDAGGVTFMSSELHDVVGGGGLMPGLSAVLSMAVTESYINTWKIPVFTAQDAGAYLAIIENAVATLACHIDEAQREADTRANFDESRFEGLFQA